MKTFDFQFILLVLKDRIVTLPAFCVAVFFTFNLKESRTFILMLLGIELLIIFYIPIRFAVKKRVFKELQFFDNPHPSFVDIIKVTALLSLQVIIFILVLYGIVAVVALWGIASVSGWLIGMILLGFWFVGYKIICLFTTLYAVTEEGILICFGLDDIFIPYSKILDAKFSNNIPVDFYKLLKGNWLYIAGVRRDNLLTLRLNSGNLIISSWFPEIHITPTDSLDWLGMIKNQI